MSGSLAGLLWRKEAVVTWRTRPCSLPPFPRRHCPWAWLGALSYDIEVSHATTYVLHFSCLRPEHFSHPSHTPTLSSLPIFCSPYGLELTERSRRQLHALRRCCHLASP